MKGIWFRGGSHESNLQSNSDINSNLRMPEVNFLRYQLRKNKNERNVNEIYNLPRGQTREETKYLQIEWWQINSDYSRVAFVEKITETSC